MSTLGEKRRESTAPADEIQRKQAPAGVFGYPAGKSIIAKKLVKLFTPHETYVEPFCGSAALYFTKQPSRVEALNDIDPDVAGALKSIQSLRPSELEELRKKDWRSDPDTFLAVRGSSPTTKVERLHKFLYMITYSYGGGRKCFNGHTNGSVSTVMNRVTKLQPRMVNTHIRNSDYEAVVKEFDGPGTFFFIDPPYPGYLAAGGGVGEKTFDEVRFRKVLDGIKGRFLVTYGSRGELDTAGYEVKRMRQARTARNMRGASSTATLTHLLVSNFKIAAKALEDEDDDDLVLDDVLGIVELEDDVRVMASGGTVLSIGSEPKMTKRAIESDDILRRYPRDVGPIPGSAFLRFTEKSVDASIVFELEGKPIAWALDVQRAPVVGDALEVAKSFSVEGSRFFRALTTGVVAELGAALLDEKPRRLMKVDAPLFELGLQTDLVHEYFLSKGDELVGRLHIERLSGSAPWHATLGGASFSVLEKGAPMPPEGVSALPSSLEKVVPGPFRYWERSGDDARLSREALSASAFFAPHNVALVDGEFCRVVSKLSIYEPEGTFSPAPDWPIQKLGELLPAGSELVEVFSPAAAALAKAGGPNRVLYCDAGDAGDGSLELLSKGLSSRSSGYVVTALDSANARVAMAKMGRPFRFLPARDVGPDGVQRLFVASFGVRTPGVEWIDKAQTKDVCMRCEKAADVDVVWAGGRAHAWFCDACFAAWKAEETDMPREIVSVKRRTDAHATSKAVTTLRVLKAEAGEERFVLGIVLEPDVVDAQNDTYNAEEVRDACHTFMADFQNVGLMHKGFINAKVKILESYIAMAEFTLGAIVVKVGTWLMAVRVLDDDLWEAVKDGGLTGFSIGGTAQRKPVTQKAAGLKTLDHQGIPVKIDRPKGFVMRGTDQEGNAWEREYKVDYGFIPRTKGGDGDGVDVFMGPNPNAPSAYWATQIKNDGTFDEYKIFLGFDSVDDARQCYVDHIPERFLNDMHETSVERMKALLNKEPSEIVKALRLT